MSAPKPFMLTPTLIEDHYHRWREVMKAVALHDGFLMGHPSFRPFYTDLLERLREDPWWRNSPNGQHDHAEYLMWDNALPDNEFFIWSKLGGIHTPQQFFGPTGFGRLRLRPINVEGVRPWDTADVPADQVKDVSPDPVDPDAA